MVSGISLPKIGGDKMAVRNNSVTNLWHKLQQDSVGWGALMLWIAGLVMLLVIITVFSGA
ncbi:hypothetical protein DP117_20290 [Brasilonema sp. UFV-L1]|nr:hypothetical protein [Brasilonema sp. UFV-L1]